MSKSLRTSIIIITVVIAALALVWVGFNFGRATTSMVGFWPGNMMGPGMMAGVNSGMGSGMVGGFGSGLVASDPISLDDARDAFESYLDSSGDGTLLLDEIMIFDNNAYAIVVEEGTRMGAFELLLDPVSKAVFPEYGPNMMWNLKYGMMSGSGGYGMMGPGMMGDFGFNIGEVVPDVSAEMPVKADEAGQIAQDYLDTYYPGVEVSDEVAAFYGYYTIDLMRDGEIVGMLSVNGYTRQVFPHTWHGDFIEMSEG